MAPGLGRVRFARWVSSQHRSTENAGGAVSAVPLKTRRRGGFVLLTMSTPAPALVITTPTEVGGALAMLSEAASDRGVLSVPRRRAGALYPKLRPGPHSFAPESVASNQRARLYGPMRRRRATSDDTERPPAGPICGVRRRVLLPGDRNRFLRSNDPGGTFQVVCEVPEAGTNPSRTSRR